MLLKSLSGKCQLLCWQQDDMNTRRVIYILWLRVSIALVSCLLLSGCAELLLSTLCTVGLRELHWNGLKAISREGSRFHPEKISSFIGLAYRPEEGTPVIAVRMPDGEFIRSDKLTEDALKPYLGKGLASRIQDGIVVNCNRGNMVVYLDNKGRMTMMIIKIYPVYTQKDTSGKEPAITIPDSNTILEFPLQEDELKELFGEPTKDETYLYVT